MFHLLLKIITGASLFLVASTSEIPTEPGKNRHPFFVSVTEIEQKNNSAILEISCKIFTDDFEKTLRQNYNTHVDLTNPVDKKNMNALIFDYIKKHLQVTVNNKNLQPEFVGFEKDEEATWCYLQVSNVSPVSNIEVSDKLLYEYKKEQISLLHIIINGNRKSKELTNPESTASFTF